ncbi:Fur family transcriptional regulator [Lacticaseibacillus nasuensis]|uniref:Fur family transcriptional regulator n=1 Tax=Lacticaseibacillus nasuensis JCM 17158 TaxID=1291734 RepID=A0A0R1JSY0_9LACO|nr:Fur family transcriptional regulator [Lacticaseibacillus nasuensis]KRK71393.1 Fur family transcriptional regulator [Lacticaseibacillus nasuensis JCM 17158]
MEETVYHQTIDRLKHARIRVTPQRDAIIQFMIASTAHPTAEQIYDALSPQFPHMSVATIYNNLKLLAELNLVEEMNSTDSATHFDFALEPHYHAICTNCGKIFDFSYPGLNDVEQVAAEKTGFKVSGHHLEVYGLCPDCQLLLGSK